MDNNINVNQEGGMNGGNRSQEVSQEGRTDAHTIYQDRGIEQERKSENDVEKSMVGEVIKNITTGNSKSDLLFKFSVVLLLFSLAGLLVVLII